MSRFNEKVQFRLFLMPCCGQSLCWVNPRLPNYCPECGNRSFAQLKIGNNTMLDVPAWIRSEPEQRKPKQSESHDGNS